MSWETGITNVTSKIPNDQNNYLPLLPSPPFMPCELWVSAKWERTNSPPETKATLAKPTISKPLAKSTISKPLELHKLLPHHCNWPEITCTSGTVTQLLLQNKNITQTVPPFICDLKNLAVINLSNNLIPQEFPKALYNCFRLEDLDLSQITSTHCRWVLLFNKYTFRYWFLCFFYVFLTVKVRMWVTTT